MKKLLLVSLAVFALSCKDNKTVFQKNLPDSVGDYNHLTLVMNDSLWLGQIGDSVRKYLAAPIDGLPQQEPQFYIDQLSPKIFVKKNRFSRNIIVFSEKEEELFTLERSKYASPQNFFTINAPTEKQMSELLYCYRDSIITTVKNLEINEKQHSINRNDKLNEKIIRDSFGVKMMIPSDYKPVLESDHFIWLKKEVESGNSNLLFYEVPLSRIENDRTVISNIVEVKDSIGKAYIHGVSESSFMKSGDGFSPFVTTMFLDYLKTYELRGIWSISNSFMQGPYICYVFKDEYYDRFLFVEGFTYNPSTSMKELIFEIESIVKTIKFYE